MSKERSWQMEWLVNQPLHVVMGGVLAGLVGWGVSYVTPLWVALAVGAVVSRLTWMARESKQKNWQYVPLWNRDLKFIDLGILIGIGVLIWIG